MPPEVEPRATPSIFCWALLLCRDWRASPVFFWHRASPFIPTSASSPRKITEHSSQFSDGRWFRPSLSLVVIGCCFYPSHLVRWFRLILSLVSLGVAFGGFVLCFWWSVLGGKGRGKGEKRNDTFKKRKGEGKKSVITLSRKKGGEGPKMPIGNSSTKPPTGRFFFPP